MKFRLLHISDLHLGSQIKGIDRNKYCRDALLKAINIIKEKNLDAMLVAGDFFENDKIYREDIEFLNELFESVSPKPVVIAPGNHDLLGLNCAYNDKFLDILKLKKWPENVKIFKKTEFAFFQIDENVNLYGKPCLNRETKAFNETVNLNPSKINIAILHASRVDLKTENKEIWHPFDTEDVLKSNFDYIALGHYHSYSEISDDTIVKSAYSGSMVPTSISEYGQRGGLIVEISKESNKTTTTTEFVELSKFSIEKIEITPDQPVEWIKNIISAKTKSRNPDDTLFIVKIKGMGYLNLMHLKDILSEYNILFDTSEFTKIDIEKLKETSPETTIGAFIHEMLRLIDNADEKEMEILEDALLYGLDAFAQKQIIPKFYDED